MKTLVVIAAILIGCVLLAECRPRRQRGSALGRSSSASASEGAEGSSLESGSSSQSRSGTSRRGAKGLFCSITWFDGEQKNSSFIRRRNGEMKEIEFECPHMEEGDVCNPDFSQTIEHDGDTATVFYCGDVEDDGEEEEETEETEEDGGEEAVPAELGAMPQFSRKRGCKEVCALNIPDYGSFSHTECEEGSSCSVVRKSIFIAQENGEFAEITPVFCSKLEEEGSPEAADAVGNGDSQGPRRGGRKRGGRKGGRRD